MCINFYKDPKYLKDIMSNKYNKKDIYYDLLELPSGDYIPVLYLLEIGIFWKTFLEIPLGNYRDWEFFKCLNCKNKLFYPGLCKKCCKNLTQEEINQYKEKLIIKYEKSIIELKKIIKNNAWNKCKYIRSYFIRLEDKNE